MAPLLHQPPRRAAAILVSLLACSSGAVSLQAQPHPAQPHPAQPHPAQAPPAPGLQLLACDVDTSGKCGCLGVWLSDRRAGLAQPELQPGPTRRVLQLDGPITPSRRAAFDAAGVALLHYLPTNAYIVDLRTADPAQLAALDFVRWHGVYEAAWKLAPSLRDEVPRMGGECTVSLLCGADPAAAAATLAALPGVKDVIQAATVAGSPTLHAVLDGAALDAAAALDSVLHIEPVNTLTDRTATARGVVQADAAGQHPLHNAGLTGAGQILGILDSGLDDWHSAFTDPESDPFGPKHRKIAYYQDIWPGDFRGHGTWVAGIAAGDSDTNTDSDNNPDTDNHLRGHAYGARLAFSLRPTSIVTSSIKSKYNAHRAAGARVHTNSWGVDANSTGEPETSYSSLTRFIDDYAYKHEEDLLVFAVSNFLTIRTPDNAKNILAVSACGNAGSQNKDGQKLKSLGGAGPTSDGRRKPDVLAPGIDITSAATGTDRGTLINSGTSAAAPAVAGLAILTRQYFTEGRYPTGAATPADALTPTGSLLRAVIVNGAQDLTDVPGYPSAREGWGRVNGDASLYLPGDSRRLLVHDIRHADTAALSTGQQWSTSFEVTSAAQELRVTMAFADPAASAGVSLAVVNNLDLVLTSPTNTEYFGNVFTDGRSSPGGSADALNSIEQVHVPSPELGVWSLRVKGTAVAAAATGPSGFAIAITGAIQEPSAPCPADQNNDGVVDAIDLVTLLGAWGPCSGCPSDQNNDGVVDAIDLVTLLGAWGPCSSDED